MIKNIIEAIPIIIYKQIFHLLYYIFNPYIYDMLIIIV